MTPGTPGLCMTQNLYYSVLGRLSMSWNTRHHDMRWNVVISGLGQLFRRWSVVCHSVLSGLRAHTRLSQARATRGDGCGATDHTAASSEPLSEWRAKGWPDPQRHPIAVPSRRDARSRRSARHLGMWAHLPSSAARQSATLRNHGRNADGQPQNVLVTCRRQHGRPAMVFRAAGVPEGRALCQCRGRADAL